jgi:hypothetical protein
MGEGDGADEWALAASKRSLREREGGEALTGGARVSTGGSGARIGPPGPGRKGGKRARASWAGNRPSRGRGESFSFFFSYSNSFLFLFYFCVFCFFFPCNKNSLNELG